jgi:P27 family predicted phage terminase small subunit
MGEEVYKLTKKQVIRRNKIHTAMTDQMKENGTYKEPFIDISERYIAMWEVSMMLEDDIQKRGVQIMTEKGPKKNDSVAMLTNMNKQMLICLEKLGLSVSTVKNELGGDI